MARGLSDLQKEILRSLPINGDWIYWRRSFLYVPLHRPDYGVSRASLSKSLKRLEERGLIERETRSEAELWTNVLGFKEYTYRVRLADKGKKLLDNNPRGSEVNDEKDQ